MVIQSVNCEKYVEGQKALGRILHTWQDFYSHSNYVSLWLEENANSKPKDIVHDDLEIVRTPRLKSGKNYGLMEFAAMIPLISSFITPLMPDDSHAKMNFDSPRSGPTFPYVYEAALKRSISVHLDIMNLLQANEVENDKIKTFVGKSIE